ncbi:MAG: hypothetical protein V7L29_27030 [Nostoc sp.]
MAYPPAVGDRTTSKTISRDSAICPSKYYGRQQRFSRKNSIDCLTIEQNLNGQNRYLVCYLSLVCPVAFL